MLTKVCTTCDVEKSVGEYSKKKRGKYGVRAVCKCCAAEQQKTHYQANRDAASEYGKVYYQANKEAMLERDKAYREANKEAEAERKRAWRQANPHIFNANNAKRRATKLRATPAWANKESIDSIYFLAAINREGGFDLHVDHIVPLQSDIVCGLHCEANLQLMPASDNISKGNRRWPDMP